MQLDPLNSPYPVPWNWVLAAHNAALASNQFTPQHYRSAALRSPQGDWLAYSRIHLVLHPQLHSCQVSSVLLIENLAKNTLQAVTANSPFTQPWGTETDEDVARGSISILMPISWNESGNQLLTRQFEARFCSSLATDYALIWNSDTGKTRTISPPGFEQAVLLGWSNTHPQSVLFEAGELRDPAPPHWRVGADGVALTIQEDQAITFGEMVADTLMGPQTSLR